MFNISSKLEKLSSAIINLWVFIIGIGFSIFGIFIKPEYKPNLISLTGNDIRTILISIGTSLIASSIIAFLSSKYLVRQSKIKEVIDLWGLEGIYETRAKMNESSNKQLDKLKDSMDIIAFGLRGFRDAKGDIIKQKVISGVKIRILTIDPNSIFVMQRETDEGAIKGEIKNTILTVEEWVKELQNVAPQKDNVQIKFYKSLPLDSYLRQDDKIYIGPYMYKKLSQQTISYEFSSNSKGYEYYKEYFDRLWDDNNFAKDHYNMFSN